MKDKQKLRRVKHLMYKYPIHFSDLWKFENGLKVKKERKEIEEDCEELKKRLSFLAEHKFSKQHIDRVTEEYEMHKLALELDIDIYALWHQISKERKEIKDAYKAKPVSEGRDNKDVYVGSGYPQGKTIRYPKKARKTAWKRFYKLFPKLNPENKK